MYRFSKRSEGILKEVHPLLADVLREAIKTAPFDFGLHEGYRSVERQYELYQQGRTKPGRVVTWIDGKTKRGYHNYRPSLAVDFHCSLPGMTWDGVKLEKIARHIQKVAREKFDLDLVWGGDWKTPDGPHIELPVEFKHYAEKEKKY